MIRMIKEPITQEEVEAFVGHPYEKMIKFVVDIRQEILGLGGELHADAEAKLLAQGCHQADLWGGNYHIQTKEVEYTSFINIRPSDGNTAIEIQDENLQNQIKKIVRKLLP